MRHQAHKQVRDMQVERNPTDTGNRATIVVTLNDNGLWSVNGTVCDTGIGAAHSVLECLHSLEDAFRNNGNRWRAAA